MSSKVEKTLINEWNRVKQGLWYERLIRAIKDKEQQALDFLASSQDTESMRRLQGEIKAYRTVAKLPDELEKKWLDNLSSE